jgi:hypothetical protein
MFADGHKATDTAIYKLLSREGEVHVMIMTGSRSDD